MGAGVTTTSTSRRREASTRCCCWSQVVPLLHAHFLLVACALMFFTSTNRSHRALALSSSRSQNNGRSAGTMRRLPIGRINKLDRSKLDTLADNAFYARPNMETHADDAFIKKLTSLYDELIPQDAVILDIMSSHVSHLPKARIESYQRVDVHGMNKNELLANEARISTNGGAYVRNLNDDPSFLGLADTGTYDAVLCCCSVQYLEEAEAVFAEVGRILKPSGICVVSFTNRYFYQKALSGWIERGMKERARLVMDYFRGAGGFVDDEMEMRGEGTGAVAQLFSLGGVGGDPFVAIVARRNRSDLQIDAVSDMNNM